MRPVNLLPARHRPRTGGSGDPRTAYFTLGALALLVVAVFGYVMTANKVSERNSEIAEVRQQIAAAEAQAVTLKDYGNFAAIKATRLAAVKSLATARIDWERLFRELAHVLPERVWLTGFTSEGETAAETGAGAGAGAGGPTLHLEGCADSHGRIADAMVRLRELHVTSEVELSQTAAPEDDAESGAATDTSDAECGSYYAFEVSVTMEPASAADAPSAGQGVPARLGGGG